MNSLFDSPRRLFRCLGVLLEFRGRILRYVNVTIRSFRGGFCGAGRRAYGLFRGRRVLMGRGRGVV